MNAVPYPTPPSLSQLREKVKHIFVSNMLCCGRKKESRDVTRQQIIGEGSAYTGLAHHHHHQQPMSTQHLRRAIQLPSGYHSGGQLPLRSRMPEMVVQSDFRKVSGISSEVFRQIEAVENEFDATTAAYFESVEKRGEMVIRLLNPQTLGRAGVEANRIYMSAASDVEHRVQFVEIIKRPGQTLGLYIREGDGYRCSDGVFISRIALESAVYNSGLLKVGDEILAVNLVDVRRMSLDDVVIIMSIPRRLVLTIRSRTYGGNQSAMMARKSIGNDYRDPPVVVVKTEVEDEPYDESNSQRDSENGHLIHARLKGLPENIPNMAVSLDGQQYRGLPPRSGTLEDQVLYYNSQPSHGRTGMRSQSTTYPMQVRDDLWSDNRTHMSRTRPYGIVTQQPNVLQRQYPRTLENLAEQVHQFYSGYSSDVPQSSSRRSGSLQVTRASVHRPPSSGRQRYWEDYAFAVGSGSTSGSLRRNARLLRTESDHGIPPTMSDDFLDRYVKPLSRGSTPTPPGYPGLVSMQDLKQRRLEDLRNSSSNQAINSILRRRSHLDGSASDTEASSPNPSHYLLRQRSLGPYSRMVRGSSRDSFQLRSSSLPRTRPINSSSDYLYSSRTPPARRGHQQRQSVRFERQAYGYDDDSDGAVSAPELPATRSRRIGRRTSSPSNYSSHEYQQWMVRAPSTSAIYESVRKGKQIPLTANSITKIAHSAESLLDTIRTEQKRTLLADLYASRAAMTGKSPSSHLTSSLFPMSREESNRCLGKASLLSHSLTFDYLRGSIPNPTPVKPSEDGRLHLLSLNPREFFKYRQEKPETGIQSEGYSGLLNVHLLAGRGLRASAGHSSEHYRDVYCVIECDRIHKARTVVRSGEHSFDWDEVFELDLFDTKEIAFLLYTWDPLFRHKLCYKGILHLASLSLNETPAHSLALKMEPRGTLYVKLRYKELQLAFQRPHSTTSSQTTTALFGVDLETVVNRENSGLNVPLIVKRCIEEIEKRGSHLVGIYRLCGSAVRKKMLRESFEKNGWLVDLTPEHVPDINVITSLLKDYIRELPEPLFTKALFDMMDDGLSVCLPDDPAGNAKLMFSILECLPKINRFTVLYLMDHLKRIMSHCERNKMSSQALAICFGPLFTCHSESESLHKPIEVFKFLLEIWPERRGSASRSGSNDSILSGKPITSKASTNIKHDQSLPPISHPISSIAQSIAMTTSTTSTSAATYSQLPPITIPSAATLSMLPSATLTPGPSPTAIITTTETPTASESTTVASDIDFGHHVSSSATTKKSVAWASNTNNHNNGSGSSGSGGTSGQSRALPFTPC